MPAIIEVTNLEKEFKNEIKTVDGLSFTVSPSQVYGFLAQNRPGNLLLSGCYWHLLSQALVILLAKLIWAYCIYHLQSLSAEHIYDDEIFGFRCLYYSTVGTVGSVGSFWRHVCFRYQ